MLSPDPQLFCKNIQYLQKTQPSLAEQLESANLSIKWIRIDEDNESCDFSLLLDESLYVRSLKDEVENATQLLLANPRKIQYVRAKCDVNASDEIQFQNLVESNLVGSDNFTFIESLPVFRQEIDAASSITSLVVLGALSFAAVASSLQRQLLNPKFSQYNLLSISLFEHSLLSFCGSLYLFDFEELIDACKDKDIGFSLNFAGSAEDLNKRLYTYFISNPLYLASSAVVRASCRDSILEACYNNIFSHDGIGYSLHAYIGTTTDEYNQVYQSCQNISSSQYLLKHSSEFNSSTAVVIGSGPSLDQNIDQLKLCQKKNLPLFASSSSLGTLLRNNIVPDFVVLLERSVVVFDDLNELIKEGYDLSQIPAIICDTVHPSVVDIFAQKCFYQRPFSTASSLNTSLKTTLKNAGPESVNASVDVCGFIGFTSLVLIGCDFGADLNCSDRSTQALGTSNRILDIPVSGSHRGTVLTNSSLILSRDSASDSIIFYDFKQIYRLGNGIAITNTIPISDISELNENLSSVNYNFENVAAAISTDQKLKTYEAISLALDEAQAWFDSLINIFDQAEEWDRQLLNKIMLYIDASSALDSSSKNKTNVLLMMNRQIIFSMSLILHDLLLNVDNSYDSSVYQSVNASLIDLRKMCLSWLQKCKSTF